MAQTCHKGQAQADRPSPDLIVGLGAFPWPAINNITNAFTAVAAPTAFLKLPTLLSILLGASLHSCSDFLFALPASG